MNPLTRYDFNHTVFLENPLRTIERRYHHWIVFYRPTLVGMAAEELHLATSHIDFHHKGNPKYATICIYTNCNTIVVSHFFQSVRSCIVIIWPHLRGLFELPMILERVDTQNKTLAEVGINNGCRMVIRFPSLVNNELLFIKEEPEESSEVPAPVEGPDELPEVKPVPVEEPVEVSVKVEPTPAEEEPILDPIVELTPTDIPVRIAAVKSTPLEESGQSSQTKGKTAKKTKKRKSRGPPVRRSERIQRMNERKNNLLRTS